MAISGGPEEEPFVLMCDEETQDLLGVSVNRIDVLLLGFALRSDFGDGVFYMFSASALGTIVSPFKKLGL